jgi:hypothetical protein
MSIELTALPAKQGTPPDGVKILNNLTNLRKAIGQSNEWKPETVAKWVGFAEAHAKKNPEFIKQAAKLGIRITVATRKKATKKNPTPTKP